MKKILALTLSAMLFLTGSSVCYGADGAAAAEEKEKAYSLTLEDGTPLDPGDGRFLIPEGEDTVILTIPSSWTLHDNYPQKVLTPEQNENGRSRYAISFKGMRWSAADLQFMEKTFGMMEIVQRARTARGQEVSDDAGAFRTGAYMSLYASDERGERVLGVSASWQLPLIQLTSFTADGAALYTPVKVDSQQQRFILDKGSDSATFHFTVDSEPVKAYLTNEAYSLTSIPVTKERNGYTFTVKDSDFGELEKLGLRLILENTQGYEQVIIVEGCRRIVDSPDAVTDYLCIGSQYTDGGNQMTGVYGLYPEKSLIGYGAWSTPISLGNFGGYITYYYEDPIRNAPENPYGVDFIVYGNSNGGGGFSEPGNVLVSEDGEVWYTLAGSEHYEEATVWGETVSYRRGADHISTILNDNEISYFYPSRQNYPLYDWKPENDEEFLVDGVKIGFNVTETGTFPAFGYVDVHTNSSASWGTGEVMGVSGVAKNPYLAVTGQKTGLIPPEDLESIYEGGGDCFDLDWAVDERGMPVHLEEVHYVKVQSAVLTTKAGGLGEKSTEVNVVSRINAEGPAAGVTAPPEKISVNGKAIDLKDGVMIYDLQEEPAQSLTVEVDAAAGANVYIGNLRADVREYKVAPRKGVVRVIVQEGKKEPRQYFIRFDAHADVVGAIEKVRKNGGETTGPVTRGFALSALYELAEDVGEICFYDGMKRDMWYTPAVSWARRAELIEGTGSGFSEEETVTREELSLILYRYAKCLREGPKAADMPEITDSAEIASWARTAASWACSEGIIPVKGDAFDPTGSIDQEELRQALDKLFELR